MKSMNIPAILTVSACLSVLLSVAFAAQDKDTLTVPNGLAFSEIEGYDTWQSVAVSGTEGGLKAILGNPEMINAYKSGIAGNGKPFPDGVKIVKIEGIKKKNLVSPYFVEIPDTLKWMGLCTVLL
jgi:hypothetical protein